jgi:hypothetical protein
MSARQPMDCELAARQACFDFAEYRKPAMKAARTTAGWDRKTKSVGRINRIETTIPKAASRWADDVKIDKRDRVLVSTASRGGRAVRAGLVVGALVASIGLAAVIIGAQASPFALAWVSGSNRYRFVDVNAAPSSVPELNSSVHIPASKKGDRLQIGGVTGRTSRETRVEAPDSPKVLSPAASSRGSGRTPSLGGAALVATAPTSTASPIAQHPTITSIGPRSVDLQPQAKLTPTLDTRPTTIEGWTIREVIDGTAVLEGPNGVVKVTRGDTVPGVGRVYTIVHWGSRWIVATSRGLITTP